MKIGFWNIAGKLSARKKPQKTIKKIVVDWFLESDLDIAVLLECGISVRELEADLKCLVHYEHCPSTVSGSYFSVFKKREIGLSNPIGSEESRIQTRRITLPFEKDISLVMIHYQSKREWNEVDQDAHLPVLKYYIDQLEQNVGHDRTIILGDFNMNPFQAGMVMSTGLHATMDKITAKEGSRIVAQKKFKYFYNPMWSFFGQEGKGEVNGTYYYRSAKPITYFWNIFDQVILRPSLIDVFNEKNLQIITAIKEQKLITSKGRIDETISDHLPVVFELNI